MKTPSENIIDTLKGKSVLFLENDHSLQNGLDEFERILKGANIEYNVLFGLSGLHFDDIVKSIRYHDAIVFQTQWVYDISKKLLEFVSALPDKKIVIECYINEPTWYYQSQHGTHHDVYIYSCPIWVDGLPFKEMEKFYKITDEPYWGYKNKFDK